MATIVRTLVVRAPVERVFAALIRFEEMHRWFVGVRRVAGEGPLEPGAHRTVTLTTGRGYRERITRFEAGKGFSYAVLDPPPGFHRWTADIDVESQNAEARISWRIRYQVAFGRVGRITDAALIAPFLRAVLATSLMRLRRQLERTSP